MEPRPFRIIPCSEWKARQPKGAIARTGKPDKAIFHHTAGHVPNSAPGETYAEACAYARSIQNYHMDSNGWNDSGHNFLVTRGGYILEGRHGSLAAVKGGKMVVSAHCPGQNSEPGVEVEHTGSEKMTAIQHDAAVWLFAWICEHCKIDAKRIYGHRDFFATACPGALYGQLPNFRNDVADALKPEPPTPKPKPPPKLGGHWLISKTFYDGHEVTEKANNLRLWTIRQGDLHKKGVRDVKAHWVETG